MTDTPIFQMRTDLETREQWKQAAAARGMTVAGLIRDAVNAYTRPQQAPQKRTACPIHTPHGTRCKACGHTH